MAAPVAQVKSGALDSRFGSPMTPEMRAWNLRVKASENQAHVGQPVTSKLGTAGIPLPTWKRAIDLAACLVALPVLALCTLAMAILTKCVSPGPIFFRQERVGYMGRRFRIYKFRTMRVGADCAVHQDYLKVLIGTNVPMQKLDARGDSRLIPFARLLRASGFDELPQIINVLRGEMSLVGPRPCIPTEFAQFKSWQRQRCDALPGLTGLWQVSGKNRTTFEQMIRLDIRYAREFSLWLDVKIIFLTIPALMGQVRDTRETRRERKSENSPRTESQPCESAKPDSVLSRVDDDGGPNGDRNEKPAPRDPAEEDRLVGDSRESLLERLAKLHRRPSPTSPVPEITQSSTP